jgi:hypothetical protein
MDILDVNVVVAQVKHHRHINSFAKHSYSFFKVPNMDWAF